MLMVKFMKILKNVFKWDTNKFLKAFIGTFIFCFAVNLFIVPAHLYNGGILGLSQLIRTLIEEVLKIHFSFDISGTINFLINLPLFFIAYKHIGKTFFYRTLFIVGIQTIFLTFIPVKPVIDDMLTATLIGGILAGFGGGLTLSSGGSGGGTDIIGTAISLRKRNLSVGKIGLSINIVIFSLLGLLRGVTTMIYSLIYTTFYNFIADRNHEQNICSTAMIFTKEKPTKIDNFIRDELMRDTTYWEGTGYYSETKTYITFCVLSKYELQRLERYLPKLDPTAFVVKTHGVNVIGDFKKYLQ